MTQRYTRAEAEAYSRQLLAGRRPAASSDAANGARDASHQVMVDGLRNSWNGGVGVPLGDRDAANAASLASAEATHQRIADGWTNGRADAEAARDEMICRLNGAYRGAV